MKDKNHTEIMVSLDSLVQTGEGINKHLDTLNGSVAKHEQRLSAQDVLNAQMTITQAQLVEELKSIKTKTELSGDFIVSSKATINTVKWLIGVLGIGNIVLIIKAFI